VSTSKTEFAGRSPVQREKILEILQERGHEGVRNTELNNVCFRYGARIYELRKMGHKIKTVNEARGLFRFVLERPSEQLSLLEAR
jgi:predicted AAA+ superfamily ATPase